MKHPTTYDLYVDLFRKGWREAARTPDNRVVEMRHPSSCGAILITGNGENPHYVRLKRREVERVERRFGL